MASPCRFCLEKTQTKDNPFIQPCICKGSVKNVHVVCINKWRAMTENPEAKYKCQLCATAFNFPTRWRRQNDTLGNSVIWYILQKQYFFILFSQAIHISYMTDNDYIYIQDFNTKESRSSFQLILLTNSSIYLFYYLYLFSQITEPKIYLYTLYKNQRFILALAILCMSYFSTHLHLFPFAYIYIYFLPFIIHLHRQTIELMNIDCEIIKSS
jgi:hypothetical protein